MEKNVLLGKLFGLAIEFQKVSGNCVFIDYSGHVNSVQISFYVGAWEIHRDKSYSEYFRINEIKVEKLEKLIAELEEMIKIKDFLPQRIEKSCFHCKWANNKGICNDECDSRRHSAWVYCKKPVEYTGITGWCATCKNKDGVGKSKICLRCASDSAMKDKITNYETDENYNK